MKLRTYLVLAVMIVMGCESGKSRGQNAPDPANDKAVERSGTETMDKTPQPKGARALSVESIAAAAGTEATAAEDGVVRIGWARTDVPVRIDGMEFPAAAGLGSWAAFLPMDKGAMVMGDTVVFQDEINLAIDAALASGLEVTALHNHFLFDDPPVYFMHIGGHGEPEKLATAVKAVWDAIKKVRAAQKMPLTRFPGASPVIKGTLDKAGIESLIGHPATVNGSVVKVVIGREATMHGTKFGGSMGLTTWAAFAGSQDMAAMDGDVAMSAAEVQPVLRALRKAGIHITALHNHMIGEEPAYYFVHFWGKGPAGELARGFRMVLDAQKERSP